MKVYSKFLLLLCSLQKDEEDVFYKSGNPGYIIGQPLMAGNLVEETQLDGSIKYPLTQLNSVIMLDPSFTVSQLSQRNYS